MSKKAIERFNVLSHDMFEYYVVKVLQKMYLNAEDLTQLGSEDLYLLDKLELKDISDEIVAYVQSYSHDEEGKNLLQMMADKITKRLSDKKEYVVSKVAMCEKEKIKLNQSMVKAIKEVLVRVPGMLMLEGLIQLALSFHPSGLVLFFIKYWLQGLVLGSGFLSACELAGYSIAITMGCGELGTLNSQVSNAVKNIQAIESAIANYKLISLMQKEVKQLESSSLSTFNKLHMTEAYKALEKNCTNVFVLFSLCKYHIEIYSHCYAKYELTKDFGWVESARFELMKCCELLKDYSSCVLDNNMISKSTKVLFLVDVLKVLKQYNGSFEEVSQPKPEQCFVMQKNAKIILEDGKRVLKSLTTEERRALFDELDVSNQSHFSRLLEYLEGDASDDKSRCVFNYGIYTNNKHAEGALNFIVQGCNIL